MHSIEYIEKLIRIKYPPFKFDIFHDVPVTPLDKKLSECTLALVTTGGLHYRNDRGFDFTVKGGDYSYRTLPGNVRQEDIAVSHKWYNHKFVLADINCMFPIDRMREYAEQKRIKSLAEEHYSFMGHIYNTGALMKHAKQLGERMKTSGVDIVYLTPG